LIDLASVSPPAENEVKAPSADPIGFSLAEIGESPVTTESCKKTRDPDVEPSSDEESDRFPPERYPQIPPVRFNPLKTTAEVYVCLSDEEDHVVDSQATIIYTHDEEDHVADSQATIIYTQAEEDHVADSQATIIYSQQAEATSKEVLPAKIPPQQKQLKQTTLSKGSRSQPISKPTVSLPRLSLATEKRLSQGNSKPTKKPVNT
jgi:hypothetical protein